MVIIDTLVNTLFGGLTLDPAGMHCPSWDDAVVSSFYFYRPVDQNVSPTWLSPSWFVAQMTGRATVKE